MNRQNAFVTLTVAVILVVLSADGVASKSFDSPEMDHSLRGRRSAADDTEIEHNHRDRRQAAAVVAPISGVVHSVADVASLNSADLQHISDEPESEENWIGNEEAEGSDDSEAMEKRKWGDNKARVWGKRKWGDNRARVWGKRRAMSPAADDYLEKFEAENRKLTDEAAQIGGKRKWGENKARIWG